MKIKNKNRAFLTKKRNLILFTLLYLLLYIIYIYQIQPVFEYIGFGVEKKSIFSFVLGLLFALIMIIIGGSLKDPFYYTLYGIILSMHFLPGIVLSVTMGWNVATSAMVVFPLLTLVFLDKFTSKNIIINPPTIKFDKKALKWIALALILVIPFLSRYKIINFSNLLFQDVYESRTLARGMSNPYIGYMTSPLLRYLLPFLLIYFIHKKKIIYSLISTLLILIIYLTTGSLKGYLVYIFLMVMMSYGAKESQKIGRFVSFLIFLLTSGFLLYAWNITDFIITYVRRALFTEEFLARQYAEYFVGNYTYYSHTKTASFFNINSIYRSKGTLTGWFGEYVIGSGTNASVGSFVEGYWSLGLVGILIASIIFGFIAYLVSNSKIDNKFIGVTALACYVFFMAQIEMVFITNGLWFFIILLLYVYPRRDNYIKDFSGKRR